MDNHINEIFSRDENKWDLEADGLIGGTFPVPNLSGAFHGLLKQWWDFYMEGKEKPRVLLVTETFGVRDTFLKLYPDWRIAIIDLYPELSKNPSRLYNSGDDFIYNDLCSMENPLILDEGFDLIISQATLEHVYNPYQAMYNMIASLKEGGILIIHTNAPNFPYHQEPRDYFRFMKDWWYDIPKNVDVAVDLVELYMEKNSHVFACYERI